MTGKAREGKRSRASLRKTHRTWRKAQVPPAGVTVTFRHVEPTEALRTYAERKLTHLTKYLKRACEVHLILSVDKYRQHGEVTVKSGRMAVTAQEETKDLYSVIDLLADKVGRQLKSHLGKVKAKKVRAPSTGEVLSAAEEILPGAGLSRA
ncbi:MAG: ribosome hibernation-promoting factor, HPF/YfiA family [Candidatus Binataceae bacterium]